MSDHIYRHTLEQITPGRLFGMVNYKGVFLRVEGERLHTEGMHLPIVELATGRLFYMARTKPCVVLFPGESPR